MLTRMRHALQRYPRQYWLLLLGTLLSATGGAMIWPFLTIFLRAQLGISRTTVTILLSINAIMGIISSFAAGPITDRLGRKGILLASLLAGVVYYVAMGWGNHSLWVYAFLLAFWGAFNPLYGVGANAMIADMVLPEERTDAYALLRTIQNVGVAIGPIAGGYLADISYTTAFLAAASTFAFFSLLTLFTFKETLATSTGASFQWGGAGYGRVLQDRQFLGFVLCFAVTNMSAALIFILLPDYVNQYYGLSEKMSGQIITTNALMCIFLQYGIARLLRNLRPLPVLGAGAVFYAVGVGSVVFGRTLTDFIISMAITTTGELIMTPTATTLAANLAPADMRGRYMSIYGLTWPIAQSIGPILGGVLGDTAGAPSIWYLGFVYGMISAVGFWWIGWRLKKRPSQGGNAAVI